MTTVAEVTACRPAKRTGLPGKRVARIAFVAVIIPAAPEAGILSRMMLVPGEVVMGDEVEVIVFDAETLLARGLDNKVEVAPLAD